MTPPDSCSPELLSDSEEEPDNNPNNPEQYGDVFLEGVIFGSDSELENMMKNPENDSELELHGICQYPYIFYLRKSRYPQPN